MWRMCSSDGGHIEKPVLLSHLNGRTTVFFLNLLYFTFAFGKMYMNTHMILLCFLRYDPVYIVAVLIVLGTAITWFNEKKEGKC